MNRLRLTHALTLALVSIALSACYGHGARSQDGQSHWLRQCLSGSACGGDEICACGVCTRLCKDDASCGADSRCAPVGEASSCSDAPAGIKQLCLASCAARTDCAGSGSALSCVDSVCVTPAARDAGPAPTAEQDAAVDAGSPKSSDAATDAATVAPIRPITNQPTFQTQFVSLQPRLVGDLLEAQVSSTAIGNTFPSLYMMTCTPEITIEKWSAELDHYAAVRDDRPPFYDNPGYFLDDVFVPPNHSLNCDAQVCAPFPRMADRIEVGETYEYVKTGTTAPPPGTSGAAAEVDVIERTALSGELKVSIAYYEESTCAVATGGGFSYEVPPPELGVCCPVGEAECASSGPRGGWAENLKACRPFTYSQDHVYVQRDDPRGCPVLIEDESSCCNCSSDADAGR